MKQQKIPTLVGILLVFGIVFLFRLLFDTVTPYISKAAATAKPENVQITNISDTSFTVTWTTNVSATGVVLVDGNGFGSLYDERDEIVSKTDDKPRLGQYKIHSVIVRNAKPKTQYSIRIVSNGSVFQNGMRPYQVTTGEAITGTGIQLEPAYGTVSYPDGKPATGALVYLTPVGGQTLSTFVTETGSWVIPLHLTRTQSLDRYIPQQERIDETILIRSAQGDSSATTDTLNDNPVPMMAIGKTYDFKKIQAETSPKPLAQNPKTETPAVLGTETTAPKTINQTVAITQPTKNAHLTTNLPLFSGTGVVGKSVSIILGISHPVAATVTVGADGIWRYTPAKPLADGKQSITITTTNGSNKPVAITHVFDIFKSGTQVLGDATPSATLTPTPTDALTPTPTDTVPAETGAPLPTSGNSTPTALFLLIGALSLLGGIAFTIL